MPPRQPRLPCLVLGIETQIGLGIVRELGRAGVPVVGIALDATAIGLESRYLVRRVLLPSGLDDQALAIVRALGEEFGGGILIAISETAVGWLIRHAADFGKIKPVVPPADAFAIVLSKARTLEMAARIGIETPRSFAFGDLAEAEQAASGLRYPAVIKWPDPGAVMKPLAQAGIEYVKYEYAYDATGLLRALGRYANLGVLPLVQEYCPGVGLGQFFFMHRGEAIRRFQHIRVAEWPPEGGFSCVCDSVSLEQHVELQEKSIALLREVGWEGVAMVEYRYDPASGRAVLMEINGRFWGSFPLAVQSGAGFARLAYEVAATGQATALPPLRGGQRCRMMSTEIKRLVRIVLQPGRIQDRSLKFSPLAEMGRFIANFLRPGVGYYVWAGDDPKPWWRDLRNMLRRSRD